MHISTASLGSPNSTSIIRNIPFSSLSPSVSIFHLLLCHPPVPLQMCAGDGCHQLPLFCHFEVLSAITALGNPTARLDPLPKGCPGTGGFADGGPFHPELLQHLGLLPGGLKDPRIPIWTQITPCSTQLLPTTDVRGILFIYLSKPKTLGWGVSPLDRGLSPWLIPASPAGSLWQEAALTLGDAPGRRSTLLEEENRISHINNILNGSASESLFPEPVFELLLCPPWPPQLQSGIKASRNQQSPRDGAVPLLLAQSIPGQTQPGQVLQSWRVRKDNSWLLSRGWIVPVGWQFHLPSQS